MELEKERNHMIEIEIEGQEDAMKEKELKKEEQTEQASGKEAEYLEMLKRLKAEFDNYRKRTEKEKEELAQYVRGNLIQELLPVLDDFERLLEAETDAEQLKKGAQMIYNNLLSILGKYGLEAFAEKGEAFDPHIHEAVAVTPAGEEHDGKIVATWQKGYRLRDRVLRPAKVQVGQRQSGKEGDE